MSQQTFNDNVVIITGASSGIGRELAYQLADQGACLALAARDKARLEAVAVECDKRGGKAIVIPTDVIESAQCEALIARTVESFGRIDTLVNNAGVSMFVLFEQITNLDLFDRLMHVNYLSAVYCTHYALPHLKKTRGRIVAVSSVTGKTGVPTRTGYAGTKHAMVGFFDSLRIEIAESGVTVTLVYPDLVATEVRQRALGADGNPVGKSTAQEDKVMTADACARLIVDGAAQRKRQVFTSTRAQLGQWLRLIAPAMVDRMALNAIARGK